MTATAVSRSSVPRLNASLPTIRKSSVGSTVALVWSEHCYLLCIALALLLALLPQHWDWPGRRLMRHLPLLLTLPLVMLSMLGWRLGSSPAIRQRSWQAAISTLLPLILLSIWIVAGSAHARFVDHYQASFLNLGVMMLAAPAAALMMIYSHAPVRLAQLFLKLLVFAAIGMTLGLIAVYGRAELYHEQIFLLIPVAVAAAIAIRNPAAAWLASICLLSTALLSQKNTSYLISLLTVLYIAMFLWLSRIERNSAVKRLWAHYLAFVCVLAMGCFACYLLYFRHRYLPTGNVEFRSFTYRAAWQKFMESPLWGTSFSDESIRKFTLYSIGIARNRLPTHSDVMDLLANGGLLAMALWLWSYLRVAVFSFRRVLAPRFLHCSWSAQAHTFAVISLAAVITYAFNPILLQPELAFLTWTTFGFLVGLAASCDPELQSGRVARGVPANTLQQTAPPIARAAARGSL